MPESQKIEMFYWLVHSSRTHIHNRMPKQPKPLDNFITTTRISGANELQKYIEEITAIANEIRKEFEDSLLQPYAIVEYRRTGRSTHDFNAEMSSVTHRDFVYTKTTLKQFSKFLQSDEAVFECLRLLETTRKMLVNNKQQKKTTVRNIRATINELKKHQQQWNEFLKIDVELEAKVSSPSIDRLEREIEMTKQNHRTITNRLIGQAATLVLVMRRNILAFKLSMEDTIGEIIRHAEKCRSFIAKCRRLELIEFCASIWWFESQHSALIEQHPELSDHRFSVSAEVQEEENERSSTMMMTFADDRTNIVVQCCCLTTVCEYHLDQNLTDIILTDEACQAFEARD